MMHRASGSRGRATRRGHLAAAVALGLLAVLPACAPKTAPPATVATPAFPEFMFPEVPAGVGSPLAHELQRRGWRMLQSGDPRAAAREFSAAVRASRGFYPGEAGLGYVSLAERDFAAAQGHFDRVIKQAQSYVPALVGRGEALLGLSRPGEAKASFEAALAVDPSLTAVRQRVNVLALRDLQASLASARRASEAGRLDEANAAYRQAIAASPESAFLYRDLAGVERRQGALDAALEHLQRAVALDPSDARSLTQIGEILESRQDYDGAVAAYAKAAAIEPTDALATRLAAARAHGEMARLPAEFRGIAGQAQIARADLAALLGVRLGRLLEASPERQAVVITDTRDSWAGRWIQTVVRAGVMDVYPNHTFQPQGPVRRADLALAVSRVLDLVGAARPQAARLWQQAEPRITDLPPRHLSYPAAAAAVAAGVMSLDAGGAFAPARPVSGAEANGVVTRLESLVRKWGLPAGPTGEASP